MRVVFTGGPSSGKTTIINKLAEEHTIVQESARELVAKHGTVLFDQREYFQSLLEALGTENFHTYPDAFYDRCLVDEIAYRGFIGTPISEKLDAECKALRYDLVFVFPPWKKIYENDVIRKETFEEANAIYERIVKVYTDYGYTPIEVPFGKVESRLEFIKIIYMIKKVAQLLNVSTDGNSHDLLAECIAKLTKIPYIQYPVAYHTVDIIATRHTDAGVEVLLGQKGKEVDKSKWVFIGGFVEPTQTAESAALRELEEETNVQVVDETRLMYLGSLFIDDARFQDSPHKVTTSIFTLQLSLHESEQAKGGDDIAEVQWVPLDKVLPLLKDHHVPLYNKFVTSKNKWFHSHHL